LEVCQYCGLPLSGVVVKHHIVNRVDSGSNDSSNLVKRHKECEEYCHVHFRHGNPEEGEGHVTRERKHNHRSKSKSRRSYLPKLSREGPSATFRPISPTRPVFELQREVPNRDKDRLDDLTERVERLERMLLPHSGGAN